MRRYSGAVAARPRAGFAPIISRGGPNLVLTWVVTEPNDPPTPQYVIVIVLLVDLNTAVPAAGDATKLLAALETCRGEIVAVDKRIVEDVSIEIIEDVLLPKLY